VCIGEYDFEVKRKEPYPGNRWDVDQVR
jgi:hypothetical protein